MEEASPTSEREVLPKSLKPVHYDLLFEPELEEANEFNGSVEIEIDVLESTSIITINSSALKIITTSVTLQSGKTIDIETASVSFNDSKEQLTIDLKEKLNAGEKVRLKQIFTGSLLHPSEAFFRAPYTAPGGTQKWMCATSMEPTLARKVFPCFDEPALKATFTVTLVVEPHLTALGNMDVLSTTSTLSNGKEKKAVTFNKSPKMSTYIVCVCVGELNYIETLAFRVPVRVYALPDKNIEHGRLALNLAPRTLKAFEKIFDEPYPLPKMDLIAIPGAPGAMENWGLITFLESMLLVDETETSAEAYRWAGSVLVHELAHQWFGNLVTMDFWEGLWLNESFADWAELYAWETLDPSWQMWENFATGAYQEGLVLDANRESHPIEVVVNKGSEIGQIFDAISYCKGSAVIQMIAGLLGVEVFIKGVQFYLKKHAYGNAKTSDLWEALSHVSGKDVAGMMDTWTKHVGYPVVGVDEKEGSVVLTQHRFLAGGEAGSTEDTVLYPLSLQLRRKEGVNAEVTLHERNNTLELPEFFKLNADHTGFYRVAYSPARLKTLAQNAKAGLLSVIDRVGLVADALAVAQSGRSKTSTVLSLLEAFQDEENFFVWKTVLSALEEITQAWTFESETVLTALKKFKTKLVSKILRKKGWDFKEGEDLIEQMFKALIFANGGDDAEVEKAAAEMFAKFADGDDQAININIRGAVFGMALEHGGEKEWEGIFKATDKTSSIDKREKCLASLGSTKSPSLLARTLEFSITPDIVSRLEVEVILRSFTKHKLGKTMLWEWVKENMDRIVEAVGDGMEGFRLMIKVILGGLGTREHWEDVKSFFDGKDTENYNVYLAQSLDTILAKAVWVERDRKDVAEWLKENGYAEK
ncbi:lysine aminopeptidase ApsA [Hyaloscypha variabilis]